MVAGGIGPASSDRAVKLCLWCYLGVPADWSFRPARGFSLSGPAELALDRRDPPLGTASLAASPAHAAGVKLAPSWHGCRCRASGPGCSQSAFGRPKPKPP